MRGAQHADATQQLSATINRRVPDKTHTRQPVPELCGLSTFANGRHVGDPPPRAHMAPICESAHATQRAVAPRAHSPPGARSPGRFRASPVSPGDGSDASVVSLACVSHYVLCCDMVPLRPFRTDNAIFLQKALFLC